MRRNLSSLWASAFVIFLTILWTIPTFGLLVTSLRPSEKASDTGWWTALWPPFDFTLTNYSEVISGGETIPSGIWPYFINSFVISIPAAIVPLVLALMAAYGLAWVKFRWSNFLFLLIFALQVVPLQMALLPLLTLFNKGWGPIPSVKSMFSRSRDRSDMWPAGGSFVPLWIVHSIPPAAGDLPAAQLHQPAAA
jgi:alpha-glucoside transport system permease protein